MAKKYQDGQYGQLVKKSQKSTQKKKKKEDRSLGRAVSQAANTVQKSSQKAISQGKGTPIRSGNQQKYQDGQYGQFIKNSRLGQSGAAQRNNTQNQQQTSSRRKQQNTKAASTYGELNERVNKRNQEQAKRRSKSAHRIADATKGTLQQTVGSHATTFYAARNPNEDKYIQSEKTREQRGEKNHSKFSEGQYGQLVKKERSGNVKDREKNLKKASEMIDKGNKNIEKAEKGLSKGGKFAMDTYNAMLGMATDAAAGPFSMGSMASRSFGAAYDTAKKEGADDTQAALYGASQAAIETGTEKMFSLAKPLKKLYGGGAGDDVAEKLLEKMTKKAATKTGKEVVYHSGKTTMAALSEGLEEMVSEGLEPAIANAIYANATGTPHSTSLKDILYAGAVGGAMGGILGGGGQAVEYNQGRKVQNVYGNDGLKTMAKKLRDVADEESGRGAVGELVNRAVDAGEEITSMQARRLYQAAAQQEEADFQRQNVMETVANNDIARKNYLNPVSRDEHGIMLVGEVTLHRYDEVAQKVENQVNESGIAKGLEMPETQVQQIASAISAIQTGVAGTNEVNMFLAANPKARTVYETVTGEKLPAENTAVKDTLYAKIAANRVESAKLESEGFADRVKGGMVQDVAKNYEASGQSAFEQMMRNADVMNAAQTQNDIVSFEDYYLAGRNGVSYETVARMNNPVHQASSAKVRQAAWEAGCTDAVLAADTAKGVQMEIGKKISQSRSNRKSGRHRGKVVSELSQEAKRNLPASQQKMFRQLARAFNIDIHIVDEEGFNGKYQDGEVYLSMQADRDLPYVFGHEITHHMQEYAPQEYNDLKELVRQAWAEKGGIDDAVNSKIAQYVEKGVELSYEDALDEIIADSTYEMIQDESFVRQLCSENRTLSQKILDAIKNVLSKLRQVLAEGDGFTPAQNAALLSNLDILKDAEKLWTDGLMKTVENRDAVGERNAQNVRYSKNNAQSSIRDQIRANLNILDNMEPVANVKYESIKDLSRSQKAAAIMREYDKKFKGGIERKGFGFIVIRNDEVTGSLKYLHTDGEFGAFKVLPQVLKRGKVIDGHKEHKGRAIDTVTIAAPVTINETTGYMAAAVKVGGKNRYHVHRILMPDGSEFEFKEKTEPIGAGVPTKNGSKGSAVSSVSNNSISQNSKNDNGKFSLGYHAGDLGKSESLATQSGGRSTGHFGTGTYFVGNKEQLKDYNKRDGKEAPVEEVDFDNYNLYKPADTKAAYELHDFLKGINEYYGSYGFGTLDEGGIKDIMSQADDLLYEMQENGSSDADARAFLEEVSGKDFSEDSRDDIEEALYNFTNDRSHEISRLEKVAEFNETIPEMSKALGIDEEELIKKVVDIKSELESVQGFEARRFHDSASTMFMKSLGYEGVDVRHTKLDNTAYGSVIYDLKGRDAERKAEIGTARFSLKDPVEQSGNLIALHNVSADKLLRTLKLGGFPMPSIAVTKADIGHTDFGDISLLLSKDTIDPARKENKVYGADAWTPMFPAVEYELDSEAAYSRANKVGSLTFFNPVFLNESNLQNAISNSSDKNAEEQLFDRFKDDYGLKNMYLAETSEPVKMEKTEKEIYPKERVEKLQEYIDILGEDGIRKIKEEHDTNSEDFAKAKEICAKQRGKGVSEIKPIFVNIDLSAALNYSEKGNVEVVDDEDATKKLIDKKVNQKDYEEWLRELFDGIVKDKGLWNGEDPYTSSGDLKDFNKIHMPVTADNIVRAMLMQADDVRNDSNLFLGTRTVRAVAAEDFKSIEGIRKASGKLKNINTEEYDSVKDELDNRLNSIMREISDGTHKSDNEFMDMDSLGKGIEDACRKPTPENFKKVLSEYGWEISDKQAKELNEVVSDIANMPVNMFEAKPQRVVGFNEIEAAVVPSDASKEVRDALNDAGIETIDYEAENEADRIAKVNDVAEQKKVKFSLPGQKRETYNQYDYKEMAEMISVGQELANKYDTLEQFAYSSDFDKYTLRQLEFIGLGFENPNWKPDGIKTYYRIGEPAIGKDGRYANSHNYAEDSAEQGVSVATTKWLHSLKSVFFGTDDEAIKERGVYKMKGLELPHVGGDDEALIIPTGWAERTKIRTRSGLEKAVQKSEGESAKYSLPDESSIMDYAADHETEFVEVPPVRDYERRARGAKQQTYNELRAQVDKLKQDKKLTKGRILNKKSVKEQINDMVVMLKSYGDPDGKKTDHKLVNAATENISSIFRYMKEGDYAGAVNQAYNSAQDMIDNLHLVDDSMMREYKELRDVMRTTKISISEEDAASIPDFKEWKKSQFGRLRIANDGMAVDSFYEVLCEKYPELFDYSVSHPADQLQAMADVRESMEPIDIMLDSEERSDLIKQTAQDMIDIAATGKPWKSWADRKKETYDEQVKRLKQRQKEALRDLSQKEKERYDKKLQQERQKWKERQQKESEKHKEKLAAEKEKYKSKQQKQKYSRERREIKAKIENTHKWISDRLLKPTDDKHIPEDFRKQIARVLVSLDMQTERSKDLELKYGVSKATLKLHALRSRYEEIAKEDGTGIFAYDDTLDADMDTLANLVDGKSVDQLTNEELEGLHQILKSIKFQIGSYNKWMSGYRNSSISEVANKSINACKAKQKHIKNHGKKREDGEFYEGTGLAGLGQSIDYAMLTPGDAFERFGEGMNEAYGALREGFDKHIQNIQTIRNFFDDVFTPYFKKTKLRKRAKPGSKIEEWRNTSTLKTFEVTGGTIKLNTSQIMSLYCLSKREQAMGHILGSGIVASRVDPVAKIAKKLGKGAIKAIGGKSLVQGSAVTVSFDDVEMIKKSLSNDQVEVCEKIMQFMNETCSAWGNEVSMKLYDYNKFTEANYFPIKSSDAYIDTVTDGTRQMQSVTSYGFTKGTVVNAKNAIVIDDIFSVAADHMNKMSLYNAFAAPMYDFNKFYNYRVADEDGNVTVSVKSALKDAHGERAEKYINTFLKDVNNQASESLDGLTKIASSSLAAYKKSVIAANTRVALQQPTAVARAFIMIDPKYFLGKDSQLPKDEKFFKNMKDMQEHCPIALWKSWGFSQVDMARGIDDIMMNNEWTRMDRYTMEIYGALDNITWGQIWGAVRQETIDKHPDVQVNSDEFYEICSQRASRIFDKTQVVDSVFHRSQIMRGSDTLSKMLSSFMAEPTRTYNMMRTELIEGMDMIRSGEAGGQAKIARAISVFLFNAALCSAAAAVADALRRRDPDWDDDDDGSDWTFLEYWEKNAWANFKDNANPLNMIPVLKDLVSYTDGWDAQNMAMQGWAQLMDSFKRVCEGEDDKAFSDLMDALGMVTGVPIKNIKREAKTWFEFFGIDVSAATKDEDKESGNSLIKKARDFLSKRKSGSKSKGNDLEEFNYDDRVAKAKKDSKGLSGEEKQDAIWSAVTENYTNYIKAGDTETLKAMRRAYEASGGDMDHFNETMLKKTKELYKKNIGEGGDAQKVAKYREYLQSEFGYTDRKISQEIVAKSNTAKAFQKNLCDGNEEDAVKALSSLIDAGISYEDFVTLYYNREKSLKASDYITGEFAAPVDGRITSDFGYRSSPGGIGSTDHKGLDIAVPLNSDVAAADGGKVKSASWQGGYGYMVTIDHGNGRTTQYAHLNSYYVKRGDVVKKGQIIALSGSTGNSTGPHLHFEVRENDVPVNPMNYLK